VRAKNNRAAPPSPDGEPTTEAAPDDQADDTGPIRRCLVTGMRLRKERLVRFALDPDGVIVPDVAASLPGRGYWLEARREVVALAVKKRAFARAARRDVVIPADLADRVEALLALRCRDAIGLARRAGLAVAGFEKVAQALKAGGIGTLLCALDAAANGREKIAALARALGVDGEIIAVLNSAELGAAFGRDHIVHAALGRGALAERLRADARRLGGFRAIPATPGG
jgi:uncharacterized protein